MLSRRMILIGLLLAILAGGVLVAAQGGGDSWLVEDLIRINIPEGVNSYDLLPAPDGRHVAYARREDDSRSLCMADVTTAEESCLPLPDDFPQGLSPADDLYLPPLVWSPDSTKLAVVGRPWPRVDNDLWLVDFEAETLVNLTDDDYAGNIPPREDESLPTFGAFVDLAPAWSPDGSQIAIERTTVDGDGNFTASAIVLVNVARGAIRRLASVPGGEDTPFEPRRTRGLAWSPDGTTLAVSILETFDARDPADAKIDGLYLLDVADGTMTHLVSMVDADAAMAERNLTERLGLMALTSLRWSPDGAHLSFWVGNAYMGMPGDPYGAEWLFWVTPEGGAIQAVSLPGVSFPFADGLYLPLPFQAAWSPDGQALLVAVGRRDSAAYREYDATRDPLADETFTPLDSDVEDDYEARRLGLYMADPVSGESVLLGHLPTMFVPPHVSEWGADGDVIVNGYHLRLAQE